MDVKDHGGHYSHSDQRRPEAGEETDGLGPALGRIGLSQGEAHRSQVGTIGDLLADGTPVT
jgi:hypothetical protein